MTTPPGDLKPNEFEDIRNQIVSADRYRLVKLVDEAKKSLEGWRDKNLKYDATQRKYIAAFGVNEGRAQAFQQVSQLLVSEPFELDKIITLCDDEKFRKQAGFDEDRGSLSVTRRLFNPVLFPIWHRVRTLRDNIKKQEEFYQKFRDPRVLTKILSDDECLAALDADDMRMILKYCYSKDDPRSADNRYLYLKLLKDKFNNEKHRFSNGKKFFNKSTIDQILGNKADAAQLRRDFEIPVRIPAGARPAGIAADMEAEILPPEFSYQLEENGLAVAELMLVKEYGGVLCDAFSSLPEIKTNFPEHKQEASAKVKFFHLPIQPVSAAHLHIENKRQIFAEELRSLVGSVKEEKAKEPVIFSGILRQGGNHYIPYFIHKRKDGGTVDVICVDPSAQTRVHDEKQNKGNIDPKIEAINKLRQLFEDVFNRSGMQCNFHDPNITQQVRENDCGFNSLTVLQDAYKKSTTAAPLIDFDNTGKMIIHGDRLTVNLNGNKYRVSDEQGVYQYKNSAFKACADNRTYWANLLRRQVNEYQFLKTNEPSTINSKFSVLPVGEYNYDLSVNMQNRADAASNLHSRVAATFPDDYESRKKLFRQNLEVPDIAKYADYVRQHPDVMKELKRHGAELESVVKIVLEKQIKDEFEPALIGYFDTYLSREEKALDGEKLDKHALVAGYLELKRPDVNGFFEKLNVADAVRLKKQLEEHAEKFIERSSKEEYERVADQLIKVINSKGIEDLNKWFVEPRFPDLQKLAQKLEIKHSLSNEEKSEKKEKAEEKVERAVQKRVKQLIMEKVAKYEGDAAAIAQMIMSEYTSVSSYIGKYTVQNATAWADECFAARFKGQDIAKIVLSNLDLGLLSIKDDIKLSALKANTDRDEKDPPQKSLIKLMQDGTNPGHAALQKAFDSFIAGQKEQNDLIADLREQDKLIQVFYLMLDTYDTALQSARHDDKDQKSDNRFKENTDLLNVKNQCFKLSECMSEVRILVEKSRIAEDKENKLKEAKIKLQQIGKDFAYWLASSYTIGAVRFDSFSPRVRQLLGMVFKLTDKPVACMSTEDAVKLDKRIKEKLVAINKNGFPEKFKMVTGEYFWDTPLYTRPTGQMPETKDQDVTRQLLSQLATEWGYECHQAKANSSSLALDKLYKALNSMPVKSDKMAPAWCSEHLKDLLKMKVDDDLSRKYVRAIQQLKHGVKLASEICANPQCSSGPGLAAAKK